MKSCYFNSTLQILAVPFVLTFIGEHIQTNKNEPVQITGANFIYRLSVLPLIRLLVTALKEFLEYYELII